MYSQQEASLARQKFWISFGRYMSPIPSANGEKANWINYRTGIKFLNFKMNVDNEQAYVGIELTQPEEQERILFFNHFSTFKKPLQEILGEDWTWEARTRNENGQQFARIFTTKQPLNLYKEDDWPAIISFLKTRMIQLDKFWTEYREIFEMLT